MRTWFWSTFVGMAATFLALKGTRTGVEILAWQLSGSVAGLLVNTGLDVFAKRRKSKVTNPDRN